jgi:hypothetical protein
VDVEALATFLLDVDMVQHRGQLELQAAPATTTAAELGLASKSPGRSGHLARAVLVEFAIVRLVLQLLAEASKGGLFAVHRLFSQALSSEERYPPSVFLQERALSPF